MNYDFIDAFCLSKPGAVGEYKVEWEAQIYTVGGKLFALRGEEKSKRPVLTLKCPPALAAAYRDNYEEVIPGYYMNKDHWNSVLLDGGFPEDILKEMILVSYDLVFKGLTKKAKSSILGDS